MEKITRNSLTPQCKIRIIMGPFFKGAVGLGAYISCLKLKTANFKTNDIHKMCKTMLFFFFPAEIATNR